MLRIAICDDDVSVTAKIEDLIYQYEHSNEFECDVYYGGKSLYDAIKTGELYDLIFLDIEMPNMDGIETAQQIRNVDKNALIIFVTSYTEYAIAAFEVKAFRFLQKPIQNEIFEKYYNEAIRTIVKKAKYYRYIFKRNHYQVLIEDILYFESKKRTIEIHTNGKEVGVFYATLDYVEEQLDKNKLTFYRVNKSILINPDAVYCHKHNCLILKNGEEFSKAPERREKINQIFCAIKAGELNG